MLQPPCEPFNPYGTFRRKQILFLSIIPTQQALHLHHIRPTPSLPTIQHQPIIPLPTTTPITFHLLRNPIHKMVALEFPGIAGQAAFIALLPLIPLLQFHILKKRFVQTTIFHILTQVIHNILESICPSPSSIRHRLALLPPLLAANNSLPWDLG